MRQYQCVHHQISRSVVECWKGLFKVPYEVIYSHMSVKNGENRERDAGVHLLGIMLSSGLPPYTEGSQSERTK